ncbi:MAG: hypothetical protein FJW23_09425 [Acidimicrobiia bacterium]|nr:hypothetical protein [Acidimicrobiia bacterium]
MKVVASVQVRMGSGRLPGKTMLEVAGRPLLGHLLDRLARATRLDAVVVATPDNAANDVIADYCAGRDIPCFRGSEDDVLGRTLGALRMMQATVGVEAFGDSPLIDPAVVDRMVGVFLEAGGSLDFVGNDLTTTYPPGMDVEVFSVAALEDAACRTDDPAVREHGTLFIRQHPERYRILNVEAPPEHRHPDISLEVDTGEDAQVVRAILEHFEGRADCTLDDIVRFLRTRDDLRVLNAHVPRRWKAYRMEHA